MPPGGGSALPCPTRTPAAPCRRRAGWAAGRPTSRRSSRRGRPCRGSSCTRRTTWAGPRPSGSSGGRRDYPVSPTASGSRSGDGALDARHLARLRALADRIEPCLVSEHLSWSIAGGAYLNHLLPLPYTEETLAVVAGHVGRAQDVLGRRILIENPSSYLRFRHSTIAEPELLAALVGLTGCALLCDVNNIFVTAHNLGLDPVAYLDALPRIGGGLNLAVTR